MEHHQQQPLSPSSRLLLAATALSTVISTFFMFMQRRRRIRVALATYLNKRRAAKRHTKRSGHWWNVIVPTMDDEQFHENFRMSRAHMQKLAQLLHPSPDDVGALAYSFLRSTSMETAVCMFLNRLGTPETCRCIGNQFGVSRSWVCKVTTCIAQLCVKKLGKLIVTPSSEDEWRRIAARWARSSKNRIPGACGAIDGTHIDIWKPAGPPNVSSRFFNRKQCWSYNVLAAVDDRGLFIAVRTGTPGSAHDSRVLRGSKFFRICNATVPRGCFLLGDKAYPLLPWLLIGYKDMDRNCPLPPYKTAFNLCVSTLRTRVEHSFGALKTRWRKLKHFEMRDQDVLNSFILSAFILHNYVEILEHEDEWDIDTNFEAWPELDGNTHYPRVQVTDADQNRAKFRREKLARSLLYDPAAMQQ